MSELGQPKKAPCIICHRVTSGLHRSYKKRALEVLKTFFLSFENYVDDNHGDALPLQEASSAEILPCPECWRMVQSFCEWHEQLQSIEKMLNERVDKLQGLMVTAWRSPSIQEAFREAATKPSRGRGITEEVVDSIFEHKEALIRKCDRKLKRPVPSLPTEKTGPARKARPGPASSKRPKLLELEPTFRPNSGIASIANTLVQRKRKRGQLNTGTPPTPEDDEEMASSPEEDCTEADPLQFEPAAIVKEEYDSDADPGADSDSASGHPVSDPLDLPGSPEVNQEEEDADESQMDTNTSPSSPLEAIPSKSSSSTQEGNPEESAPKYQCERCDKVFPYRALYKMHFERDHLKIRYPCDECGKLFTRNDGLLEHKKVVHLKVKDYSCSLCGKDFGLVRNLQCHMKTVHSNSRDHVCSQCGKGHPTAVYLKRHMASAHSELGEFPCEVCGKVLYTAFSFHAHRRDVHGIKRK